MNFVIGKYYRDTYGRKLQYIGNNNNLSEFVLNNDDGSKIHIRIQSNDPIINQFVLIEDEDSTQTDHEYPDAFDGGKVRQKKSRPKKSRQKKSKRNKSRKNKSTRKEIRKKKKIIEFIF